MLRLVAQEEYVGPAVWHHLWPCFDVAQFVLAKIKRLYHLHFAVQLFYKAQKYLLYMI